MLEIFVFNNRHRCTLESRDNKKWNERNGDNKENESNNEESDSDNDNDDDDDDDDDSDVNNDDDEVFEGLNSKIPRLDRSKINPFFPPSNTKYKAKATDSKDEDLENNNISPNMDMPIENNNISPNMDMPIENNNISPNMDMPVENNNISPNMDMPVENNNISPNMGVPVEHDSKRFDSNDNGSQPPSNEKQILNPNSRAAGKDNSQMIQGSKTPEEQRKYKDNIETKTTKAGSENKKKENKKILRVCLHSSNSEPIGDASSLDVPSSPSIYLETEHDDENNPSPSLEGNLVETPSDVSDNNTSTPLSQGNRRGTDEDENQSVSVSTSNQIVHGRTEDALEGGEAGVSSLWSQPSSRPGRHLIGSNQTAFFLAVPIKDNRGRASRARASREKTEFLVGDLEGLRPPRASTPIFFDDSESESSEELESPTDPPKMFLHDPRQHMDLHLKQPVASRIPQMTPGISPDTRRTTDPYESTDQPASNPSTKPLSSNTSTKLPTKQPLTATSSEQYSDKTSPKQFTVDPSPEQATGSSNRFTGNTSTKQPTGHTSSGFPNSVLSNTPRVISHTTQDIFDDNRLQGDARSAPQDSRIHTINPDEKIQPQKATQSESASNSTRSMSEGIKNVKNGKKTQDTLTSKNHHPSPAPPPLPLFTKSTVQVEEGENKVVKPRPTKLPNLKVKALSQPVQTSPSHNDDTQNHSNAKSATKPGSSTTSNSSTNPKMNDETHMNQKTSQTPASKSPEPTTLSTSGPSNEIYSKDTERKIQSPPPSRIPSSGSNTRPMPVSSPQSDTTSHTTKQSGNPSLGIAVTPKHEVESSQGSKVKQQSGFVTKLPVSKPGIPIPHSSLASQPKSSGEPTKSLTKPSPNVNPTTTNMNSSTTPSPMTTNVASSPKASSIATNATLTSPQSSTLLGDTDDCSTEHDQTATPGTKRPFLKRPNFFSNLNLGFSSKPKAPSATQLPGDSAHGKARRNESHQQIGSKTGGDNLRNYLGTQHETTAATNQNQRGKSKTDNPSTSITQERLSRDGFQPLDHSGSNPSGPDKHDEQNADEVNPPEQVERKSRPSGNTKSSLTPKSTSASSSSSSKPKRVKKLRISKQKHSPFGPYTLEGILAICVLTFVCLHTNIGVNGFLFYITACYYTFAVLRILGILK